MIVSLFHPAIRRKPTLCYARRRATSSSLGARRSWRRRREAAQSAVNTRPSTPRSTKRRRVEDRDQHRIPETSGARSARKLRAQREFGGKRVAERQPHRRQRELLIRERTRPIDHRGGKCAGQQQQARSREPANVALRSPPCPRRTRSSYAKAGRVSTRAQIRLAREGREVLCARHATRKPRRGGVAERLKAHAWKVCMRETVSRVRIPPPPPRPLRRQPSSFIIDRFFIKMSKR